MTMPAARKRTPLIDRLPPVRGRLTAGAPLANTTWFRVGGPAEVLFKPADLEDLRAFMAAKPTDVPVTLLGVGSNLLVRDGDYVAMSRWRLPPWTPASSCAAATASGRSRLPISIAFPATRLSATRRSSAATSSSP